MNKNRDKWSLIICFCLVGLSSFGNAGIFGGLGKNISLQSTRKIQMVSEEVNIYLGRAEQPVTGGAAWLELDKAIYNCTFELKNLTDKKVTVPVGFPLSSYNYVLPRFTKNKQSVNQTKIISRFNFIVGTKNGTFPVRYVDNDADKKFSKLFLWEMTFKPGETIFLNVSYEMPGYYGLGSTRKNQRDWKGYELPYLNMMDMSVEERFGYVTATGKSWAGKIEKAIFQVYVGTFEKYLRKRGAEEVDEDYIYYKKVQQRERFSSFERRIEPAGWKVLNEKNKTIIKWEYTNFEAGPELIIRYSFLCIPQNLDDYKHLIAIKRKQYARELKRSMFLKATAKQKKLLPWSNKIERNIADVVLEYYGIKTGNKEISNFLNKQNWYPVKQPRLIELELKDELMKLHNN